MEGGGIGMGTIKGQKQLYCEQVVNHSTYNKIFKKIIVLEILRFTNY